jgi:hypothetical protein
MVVVIEGSLVVLAGVVKRLKERRLIENQALPWKGVAI